MPVSPVGDGAGAQPWGHHHEEQQLNKTASLSRGRAQAAARSEAKGPGEHGGAALALDGLAVLWNGQPGPNEATISAKAGAAFKRRKHMRYGYARVSTIEQDHALQLAALKAAQCAHIVQEKRSGVKQRPELEQLLSKLKQGDELVIYKLDRLARSLKDLLSIVERLQAKGAHLRSLTEPLNHDTPAGRMMLQMLGVFAEFERSIIRERCMAGQLEALRQGRRIGRPSRIPLKEQSEIVELIAAGMPHRVVADAYGISASRALAIYHEAIGRKRRNWGVLRTLYYDNINHAR